VGGPHAPRVAPAPVQRLECHAVGVGMKEPRCLLPRAHQVAEGIRRQNGARSNVNAHLLRCGRSKA
jgi:hypothetical protein